MGKIKLQAAAIFNNFFELFVSFKAKLIKCLEVGTLKV